MPAWLIPAVFAAFVAIAITLSIEYFGGKRGGLLGSLPSTIVPAAIGLAAASPSIAEFQDALRITPAGMLINAIFLSVWIYLPPRIQDMSVRRSLAVTTATALVAWAIFGTMAIFCIDYASDSGLGTRDIAVIGVVLTAAFGIYLGWSPGDSPKGSREVSKSVLLARGGMAATAIGASVWVAGLGYPLIAGLASVFPAIFLTSMVALWISQGPSVPRGAAAPMLLGGGSVGVYALVAMYSLDSHGMIIGSAIAWTVAVAGWSIPSYAFLRWRSGVGTAS